MGPLKEGSFFCDAILYIRYKKYFENFFKNICRIKNCRYLCNRI